MCKYILVTGFLNHNIVSGVDIVSDTVGATCCLPIKDNKDRWEVEGSPRGKGLMSQFHCNNGARAPEYCHYCSLTQCASADQKTTSHAVSEPLISSHRASQYFNGWRGFLGNLLLWEGPQWPWRLPVVSFKQEQERNACLPPITSWLSEAFTFFIQSNISASIQVFFLFTPLNL